MSGPRVYVETTIPSFYHEARTAPDVIARGNGPGVGGIRPTIATNS